MPWIWAKNEKKIGKFFQIFFFNLENFKIFLGVLSLVKPQKILSSTLIKMKGNLLLQDNSKFAKPLVKYIW
jgi:hypothetical protein